jgi:hypothetical protein
MAYIKELQKQTRGIEKNHENLKITGLKIENENQGLWRYGRTS